MTVEKITNIEDLISLYLEKHSDEKMRVFFGRLIDQKKIILTDFEPEEIDYFVTKINKKVNSIFYVLVAKTQESDLRHIRYFLTKYSDTLNFKLERYFYYCIIFKAVTCNLFIEIGYQLNYDLLFKKAYTHCNLKLILIIIDHKLVSQTKIDAIIAESLFVEEKSVKEIIELETHNLICGSDAVIEYIRDNVKNKYSNNTESELCELLLHFINKPYFDLNNCVEVFKVCVKYKHFDLVKIFLENGFNVSEHFGEINPTITFLNSCGLTTNEIYNIIK